MLAPSHFIGFGDLATDRKADAVPANWRDGIPMETSGCGAAPSTATRGRARYTGSRARLHSLSHKSRAGRRPTRTSWAILVSGV